LHQTVESNTRKSVPDGADYHPVSVLQSLSNSYRIAPGPQVERLPLAARGKLRYQLKSPHTDGTTHVVF
jgi:hypothetical protein